MTRVAIDMDAARRASARRVEAVAGAVEIESIPTPARAEEYRGKEAEVRALMALPTLAGVNLDDYPWVRDDMEARGIGDLRTAMARIIAAARDTRTRHRIVARWRAVRLGQIEQAQTVGELRAIPTDRADLDAAIAAGLSP